MENKKPICCGYFEKVARTFDWFTYNDKGVKMFVLPNINKSRVNNCPCCGAEVREIQFTESEFIALPITR